MLIARSKQVFDTAGDPLYFLEPGHVIAKRYRVKRALGRGGMGSVYLAEDLVLGENEVAIKVLQRGGDEDPAAINRFLREVQLTHRIHHENVVRTFDFGQDGDAIFYTMEYLPGQSLDVAIASGGLPYRTVVNMASQLMHGLAAVHAVGVVHRDLKPANIIVASTGTLKITDFGIARSSAAPATMFASDVFGTLRYVAPEILKGDSAHRAADFYALGVVLFELLTGRGPFAEENPARLILDKIEQQAPSIQNSRTDLPVWLMKGVEGLLERHPESRMLAVRSFAAALDTHAPRQLTGAERLLSKVVGDDSKARVGKDTKRYLRSHVQLSAIQFLWVLLGALFALPIASTEILSEIEASHADSLFRLRGPVSPHPGLVVVSMDEQSYARLGVPLTAPWPRELHKTLLTTLAEAGAKRVVFDIIFANANQDNHEDRALAEAMKRVPTVLGAALGVAQRATINGSFLLEELLQPAEIFELESVGVGVVGLPQRFGRVREFPRIHSEVFPSVSSLAEIAVALDLGHNTKPQGGALLNFYGPSKSIPTIPYEMVVSHEPAELPNDLFRDKIVFVGLGLRSSTGASQRDAFVTPYDQQTYGAELHATAASNLLQRDWIEQPSARLQAAVTLMCAGGLSLILVTLTGMTAILILAGAVAAVAATQFLLFLAGWFVPVASGILWGVFCGLLLRLVVVQPQFRTRGGRAR